MSSAGEVRGNSTAPLQQLTPPTTQQTQVSSGQNPLQNITAPPHNVNANQPTTAVEVYVTTGDKVRKAWKSVTTSLSNGKVARGWKSLTGSRFGKSTFMRGTVGFLKGLTGYSMAKRWYQYGKGNHQWQKQGSTGFYTRYNKSDLTSYNSATKKNAQANRHHNRGAHVGGSITGVLTAGILPGLAAGVGFVAGKIAKLVSGTPSLSDFRVSADNRLPNDKKIAKSIYASGKQLATKTNDVETAMRLLRNHNSDNPNSLPGDPPLPNNKEMKESLMFLTMAQSEFNSEGFEMMVGTEVLKQHPSGKNFQHMMDTYVKTRSPMEINISHTMRQNLTALDTIANQAGYDNFVAIFNVPDDVRTAYEQDPANQTAVRDYGVAIDRNIDQLAISQEQKVSLKQQVRSSNFIDSSQDNGPIAKNVGDLLNTARNETQKLLSDRWRFTMNDSPNSKADWDLGPFGKVKISKAH